MIENIFKDHKELYCIHIESNLTFIKACEIIRDAFPGFEIGFIIKYQVHGIDLIYNIEVNNIHVFCFSDAIFYDYPSIENERIKHLMIENIIIKIRTVLIRNRLTPNEIHNDTQGRWLNI